MGYLHTANGGKLCQNCLQPGGVRLRTCPYKVKSDSLRSVPVGARHEMPYCPAPALCSPCYHALKHELHASCKDGAARAQAESDRTESLLQSGAFLRIAAYGDWHKSVPAGRVGITFRNGAGEESFYHVAKDDYSASGPPTTPEDYSGAVQMERIR
jgi:hypothetical protein